MLAQIVTHANILDMLGGEVKNRLFYPSGWSAPNDTDSGISFGAEVEVGVGYMRMDVLDHRANANYTLRGGYIEVGVGLGETVKSKAVTTAAGKQVVAWAGSVAANPFAQSAQKVIKLINQKLKKPATDIVVMPGGSITQFMMGPFMTRGWLEPADFRNATWCFVYIEGDAGLGGNIGFMIMLDPTIMQVAMMAFPGAAQGSLMSMLACCKAWAPYWGLGLSLSLDVKVAVRIIQDVQMVPLSTFPL
jgi:hypothetical protein